MLELLGNLGMRGSHPIAKNLRVLHNFRGTLALGNEFQSHGQMRYVSAVPNMIIA